ncbi:multidrug ABC transporter ATP-binding protein [Capsulimonas corticalis]|uniref:Multidrug ABC transporter ATP-binding protein n=1 Tax=Capsulimonas corticalis TaxID=2219043 RepID=A0A402D057_9BACT|nr:ABC transporter ATP-binding protein [Capsulimonas corticalis]BDI33744.1 multidrug ABC transporter ATP-binding protein [Capsulimonas corticalis]
MTTNRINPPHDGGVPVVEIRNLTRRFGPKVALDDVSLTVPAGVVFGLVGENGAGKTTLIKHVLGLLKAQEGSVRIFGKDPVEDPVGVLSRIGYLAEETSLPGWMTVHELMRYTQAFYPTWDEAFAEQLRGEFGLDVRATVKNLSKGQRARAGLLAALSYRPDLLLLDEPSSGLDPIVRRDILGAIIRTIADEGRTVLFSSHLLSEVERVSDYVAMVRGGKIVFADALDTIKETHFKATLQFAEARKTAPQIPGVLHWEGLGGEWTAGREWTAVCHGRPAEIAAAAVLHGARMVAHSPASLDDIFVARVGAKIAVAQED